MLDELMNLVTSISLIELLPYVSGAIWVLYFCWPRRPELSEFFKTLMKELEEAESYNGTDTSSWVTSNNYCFYKAKSWDKYNCSNKYWAINPKLDENKDLFNLLSRKEQKLFKKNFVKKINALQQETIAKTKMEVVNKGKV